MSGLAVSADEQARAESVLRKLHLSISRRLDGLLHGDYLGVLPGAGSEAGESREYRVGDDVRSMDWPVTARTTVPHVRQTVSDRELEAWVALDLSPSMEFGTARMTKRDLAMRAVIAVSHLVIRGGNRLGIVVSNGEHTSRWPAVSGRGRAHALIKRVMATPAGKVHKQRSHTELSTVCEKLMKPERKRGQIVVISDFLAPVASGWPKQLRRLGVRHDVLAVEILDPRELRLPQVGVLELVDPETGEVREIQTSSRSLRERYAAAADEQRRQIAQHLATSGAAHLQLRTDEDWLAAIARFVSARRTGRARGQMGGVIR